MKMKKTSLIEFIFVTILFALSYWKLQFNISNFRFGLIFLILFAFIVYSEKLAHKRRMSNWKKIRSAGKARFILYDYVLIRGGIVSVLLILILSFKVSIGLLIVCSILPLFGVIAFAGNEEWKQCEEQYAIATLRSVADKFKVLQN